jgi:hypothetical protein
MKSWEENNFFRPKPFLTTEVFFNHRSFSEGGSGGCQNIVRMKADERNIKQHEAR